MPRIPEPMIARETLGMTRAVREALPIIYQLRQDGASWPAIARALAAQGVVQEKDHIPLTPNQLTTLVSQIEEKERNKKASKAAKP